MAIITATLALFSSGCRSEPVEFIDAGHAYRESDLDALLTATSPGDLAGKNAEDAPRLRQQALTSLRRKGGRAADAAQLLTATFPASTLAVPFHVERATYEGDDAWIVIEARGRTGTTLDTIRLWVLDADGGVLVSRLR